jgi:uncharacterized protein YktB (UPF0637 family)
MSRAAPGSGRIFTRDDPDVREFADELRASMHISDEERERIKPLTDEQIKQIAERLRSVT